MKILGTATVSEGMKIVLISRVAKKLNAKKGDLVVFYETDEGNIIIRNNDSVRILR
jgi:bifunctional DNA-binding transcriptional regulator/antitoxin component of YhaV-PrlF toxin-antitoxin module